MIIKNFIQAARLRTLPLSMSGIVSGSFMARWRLAEEGKDWDWLIFVFAMLVTLLYQVLSNFANDYGDGVKGTDTLRNTGAEARAVASGAISAKQMKNAVLIMAALSFVFTVILLYRAFFPDFTREFWVFVGLGITCILAAIGYTMGKKPYGYMGLGDMMVFLFFGWLSVGGSYFLFTKSWSWDVLLVASAVGMLSTAVLNLNNMRDMESDKVSGKKTIALRLGLGKAMVYQMILMQLPLMLILVFLMVNNFYARGQYYAFMVMVLMFPLSALRRRIMQVKSSQEFDPFLKQVGIITFVMAVLLASGLNLF